MNITCEELMQLLFAHITLYFGSERNGYESSSSLA